MIYFAYNSTGYRLPNRNPNKIDRLLTGYHNKTTGYQLVVAGLEIFLSVVVIYFASNSTGYRLPNRNPNKIDRLLTGYHNKTTGYQLESLHRKWLFHQTSIYKWLFGVPGRSSPSKTPSGQKNRVSVKILECHFPHRF